MSWRIIRIGTGGKLSLDNHRMRFEQTETKETFFCPIEDIAILVLENLQLSLTTALVSELSDKAVTVIFCNSKHRPVSVLSPIGKPLRQSEIAFLQTGMSEPLQKRLWQKIVRQKIFNQSVVLKPVCADKADVLQKISKHVLSGDAGNAEAIAARIYWEGVFGKNFVRHNEDGINAALDYGYAILRNVLINNIVAHGLIPNLGVHHRSVLNNFNLADDLIEAYRAFTDQTVLKTPPSPDDVLTKETREKVLALLQKKCAIGERKTTLINAMEETVCSFITAIKENNADRLLLPEFIDDEPRIATQKTACSV